MALNIDEIFFSIQGEAQDAGRLCLFIRLAECDLRCRYCDTKYSWKRGADKTAEELLQTIEANACELICFTGGEPMLQAAQLIPLMRQLVDQGYRLILETHGMADLEGVPAEVIKVVDVKIPGSFGVIKGVDSDALYPTLERNLQRLNQHDQLKFVIGSRTEYDWALEFINQHQLQHLGPRLLLSPSHGVVDPRDLIEWMKQDRLTARLNLQLHKYIWGPDVKGV